MTETSAKAKTYGPYEFRLGDELRGERATLGRSLLDIQRDLRIKAAYIAAIENCDPGVFPNPSFIAGYVRSYARYLGLDPDEVYWRFCQESGFGKLQAGELEERAPRGGALPRGRRAAAGPMPHFPLAEQGTGRLPEIPVGMIGSLVVLVALIGGLGYGGWAILENIQRVQFAPVDEVPVAVAEMPELTAPGGEEPVLPELARPVAATALVDLYRQQELEVPILVPRDGPIAAIDPDSIGLLAQPRTPAPAAPSAPATVAELLAPPPVPGSPAAEGPLEPQVVAPDARAAVTVIAERPAWVRIYLADGTVVFERILESGESYEVPPTAEPPMIWAGNSGSVYLRVGDTIHGPLGDGTRAVRDVVLEPQAIGARYEPVASLPTVVSEAVSRLAHQDVGVLRQ
jgi:hypothetical protein